MDVFNLLYKSFELNTIGNAMDNFSENFSNNNIGLYIVNKNNSSLEETILKSADRLNITLSSLKTDALDSLRTLNADMNTGFYKQLDSITQNDGSSKWDSIINELSNGFKGLNETLAVLMIDSGIDTNSKQQSNSVPESSFENSAVDYQIVEDNSTTSIITEGIEGIGQDIVMGEAAEFLQAALSGGGLAAGAAAVTPQTLLTGAFIMGVGNLLKELADYSDIRVENNSKYNLPYRDPNIKAWDKIVGAFSGNAYKLGYPYSDELNPLSTLLNLDVLSSSWFYDQTGIAGWWYDEEVQGKREYNPKKDEVGGTYNNYGGFNPNIYIPLLQGFWDKNFGVSKTSNVNMDSEQVSMLTNPNNTKSMTTNNNITPHFNINLNNLHSTSEGINSMILEINKRLKEEIKYLPEGEYQN